MIKLGIKGLRNLVFLGWGIFIILLIILIVIFAKTDNQHGYAKELSPDIEYESILFPGKISEMTADNMYAYLKKAYIMIGRYPDCEYYKISSIIERNNYEEGMFGTLSDDQRFKNFYMNGEPQGEAFIDVSSYQQKVDWQKVKEAGIKGTIIRVGFRGYESGAIVDDKTFTEKMKGAQDAGMKIGCYFFSEAINYDEGVEEANYVLGKISGYNVTEPIVIDTEYIYNVEARANEIDNQSRTDAIKGFCETIKNAGYTPMIYASRNWFVQNMDLEQLKDYELWLAHYVDTPDFPYVYKGWQYTGEGSCPGISEAVDINVWLR